MKFPTLTRLPQYKRFNFEPRYYDPVKEDIQERTSRIKQEVSQLAEGQQHNIYHSNIAGSFSKRSNYTKKTSTLQLVIFIFLIFLFGGYLWYGNYVFFIFLLIIPVYFYFRLKRISKQR